VKGLTALSGTNVQDLMMRRSLVQVSQNSGSGTVMEMTENPCLTTTWEGRATAPDDLLVLGYIVSGGFWFALSIAAACWSTLGDRALRFPFVWPDIAIVHAVCLLPLLMVVTNMVWTRLSLIVRALFAGAYWLAGIAAVAGGFGLMGLRLPGATETAGFLNRCFLSGMLLAPTAWCWMHAIPIRMVSSARQVSWLLLTLCVAFALPIGYVTARCRQDVAHFQELVSQSRLGEALNLGWKLLRLDPDATLRGETITRQVGELDVMVRQLQFKVAVVPGLGATDGEWLDRARRLAVLGQTDQALLALSKLKRSSAAACNLAGTIHESRHEWQDSLENYRRAQVAWSAIPESVERSTGEIRATTGIAFCLRKLGLYCQAEQAYRKLLEFSPQAETHFLLAQFYEDTQQSALAREHAQRAIELAPHRFKRPGQLLLQKLTISHFGCFSVWSAGTDHSLRNASTSR
jgi:tetratricopeptide (TPR) repeat protein